MMIAQKKSRALLYLAVALVAMILLSAGISELKLLPGEPLRLGLKLQDLKKSMSAGPGDAPAIINRVILAFFLVLTPLAIFFMLISPLARKRFLRHLVLLLLLFTFFYIIMYARPESLVGRIPSLTLPTLSLPAWLTGEPTHQFNPNPPRWLTLALSLGVGVIAAVAIIIVARFILSRRNSSADTRQNLAREAREALEELQGGADLADIVMRCYYQMACVANEMRGIRRRRDMTPQEFEQLLKGAGLPKKPLRQLTRLFEEIRYGTKVPGEREERHAVRCLTAIVEACRNSP